MKRFVVLVEFLRGEGGFRHLPSRDPRFDLSEVEVLAETEAEAHLIACEMVACRPNVHPTRTFASC